MLFFSVFSLFVSVPTAATLHSGPQAQHPAIDTLNHFSTKVGALAEEINKWGGDRRGVDNIILHGREAIGTLHQAVVQMNEGSDLGLLDMAFGFAAAGLSVSGKAHTFATAIQGKLPAFKAVQQQQAIFLLLDDAYTEATAFFTASKLKMPSLAFSLLKPFHSELLGTLSQAREAFRPQQEVVIIVVDGGPGQPPSTYTLPPGSPIPTSFPRPNQPLQQYPPYDPYVSSPQYNQQKPSYNPQYPQQMPSQSYGQYNPQYTGSYAQQQYTQYTPNLAQHASAPGPAQNTVRPPPSYQSPFPTGYTWYSIG